MYFIKKAAKIERASYSLIAHIYKISHTHAYYILCKDTKVGHHHIARTHISITNIDRYRHIDI